MLTDHLIILGHFIFDETVCGTNRTTVNSNANIPNLQLFSAQNLVKPIGIVVETSRDCARKSQEYTVYMFEGMLVKESVLPL